MVFILPNIEKWRIEGKKAVVYLIFSYVDSLMIYGPEMLFQYSLQPQSRRKLDDLLQWSSSEPSRYMSWAKIFKLIENPGNYCITPWKPLDDQLRRIGSPSTMVCKETPAATTCWPSLPRCPGGNGRTLHFWNPKMRVETGPFSSSNGGIFWIVLPASINVMLFGFSRLFCAHSALTRCLIWNPFISSPPR